MFLWYVVPDSILPIFRVASPHITILWSKNRNEIVYDMLLRECLWPSSIGRVSFFGSIAGIRSLEGLMKFSAKDHTYFIVFFFFVDLSLLSGSLKGQFSGSATRSTWKCIVDERVWWCGAWALRWSDSHAVHAAMHRVVAPWLTRRRTLDRILPGVRIGRSMTSSLEPSGEIANPWSLPLFDDSKWSLRLALSSLSHSLPMCNSIMQEDTNFIFAEGKQNA